MPWQGINRIAEATHRRRRRYATGLILVRSERKTQSGRCEGVVNIFELRQAAVGGEADNPVFIPTLLYPPTAWRLSLAYAEGGFNASGGMSTNTNGNLWTNNNFIPGSQSIRFNTSGPTPPGPTIVQRNRDHESELEWRSAVTTHRLSRRRNLGSRIKCTHLLQNSGR